MRRAPMTMISRPSGPASYPRHVAGSDAHHVAYLQLDDLLVELHSPVSGHDHVHLLLLLMRVAVWKAITGRKPLVAQAGLFKLERLGRQSERQVRRTAEFGPEILQILFEVRERERHRRQSYGAADQRPDTLGTCCHCVRRGSVRLLDEKLSATLVPPNGCVRRVDPNDQAGRITLAIRRPDELRGSVRALADRLAASPER